MASKVRAPATQKAPKLQWTADQATIDKLRQAGQFSHVGGPRAKTSRLTGALNNKWEKDEPQAIFNTTYRISGPTPQAVYDALILAGYDNAQAQQIVADSVSFANYQSSKKAEYDAEFAHRKGMPKVKKEPTEPGYEASEILWFAEQLKKKGHVRIEKNESAGKKAVSHPGRAHAGVSFAEKLRNVPAGKVLDVSNMDLVSEYGHGARTIQAPGPKSGKLGSALVPGLVSNNPATYRRAIQLAGTENGEAAIAQVEAALNKGQGGALVVPGQTLAPPVNFQVPSVAGGVRPPAPLLPKVGTPKVGTIGGAQLPQLPVFRK